MKIGKHMRFQMFLNGQTSAFLKGCKSSPPLCINKNNRFLAEQKVTDRRFPSKTEYL